MVAKKTFYNTHMNESFRHGQMLLAQHIQGIRKSYGVRLARVRNRFTVTQSVGMVAAQAEARELDR
jgi:hypothetical protein